MSALSGIDIALWDLKARRLHMPLYQLLGGKVRHKVKVYAWIGGDRPRDVEAAAKERIAQGFRAIKMNATEDVDWLDSPRALETSVERLKTVKALGMDAGLDFHGRLHKPMVRIIENPLIKLFIITGGVFLVEAASQSSRATSPPFYRGTSSFRALRRHQAALLTDHYPHRSRRATIQSLGR